MKEYRLMTIMTGNFRRYSQSVVRLQLNSDNGYVVYESFI